MPQEQYGEFEYEPSLYELFENCISPTILQSYIFTSQLLIYNTIFTTILHFFCTSEKLFHIISTLTGLCYIYLCAFLFNNEAYHVLPLVYISYILLHVFKRFNMNAGYSIGALMISVLITYEFAYHSHEAWLQIKSVVMIAMMKIISIAFDMNMKENHRIPSIWAYSGYIWCPANSVLGPWISYKDYMERFTKRPKYNFQWIISIFQYSFIALLFVTFSNCLATYFIPESVNRFILSYRDAICFRTSHYFISYLASAAMVSGGFKSSQKQEKWAYTITNPIDIELPRSLVSVVINWNIPTHTFLKKYIFAGFLKYGNFIAVLMTYLVSSMLHGLNVEVSMVLLSLGLFSYVQFKFQDAIANLFNCCVRVRACRNCKHTNRYNMKYVMNVGFMLMTIVYLAYTGCLMTNVNHSDDADQVFDLIVAKWQQLHFYGHYTALFSVFITCVIT